MDPETGPFLPHSLIELLIAIGGGIVVLGTVAFLTLVLYRVVKYKRAPVEGAEAVCIGKRQRSSDDSTWYYATFQLEDGSRKELQLSGRDYGMLAEGDRGMLRWKDSVYQGLAPTTAFPAYRDTASITANPTDLR